MTPSTSVILIDDEADVLRAYTQGLTLAGFTVTAFPRAELALASLSDAFDGAVVCDVRMPGMDGLELFRRVQALDPDIPVILISGHADIATAVGAVHLGAYDFLSKPFSPEALAQRVRCALEQRRLVLDNRLLRQRVEDPQTHSPLIGISPAITALRRMIAQIAETEVDVLIEGETGSGKSLVARMLHDQSRRARRSLVTVDCGALPQANCDAILLGHVAGAFTGATVPRSGKFAEAHRSTLFLDAIDAAPPPVQHQFRQVLEAREVTPLGATIAKPLDLRVIAATSADLTGLVKTGDFIASLQFQLNSLTLRLPPLRERREDIPLLFASFAADAAQRYDRSAPKLSASMWKRLTDYHWPGNVRELRQFADHSVLRLPSMLDIPAKPTTLSSTADLKSRMADYERALIAEALETAHGDVSTAMHHLNIPRKTFYDKVKRLSIDLNAHRLRR